MRKKNNSFLFSQFVIIIAVSFFLTGCKTTSVFNFNQKEQENFNSDTQIENNNEIATVATDENSATNQNNEEQLISGENITANNQIINDEYKNLMNIPDNELTPDQKIIKRQAGLILPFTLREDIGAQLKVCNIGPDCSGDMGSLYWMISASININDTKRGLTWSTNKSDVKDGLLQISLVPFNQAWPGQDIIFSQNVKTGALIFDFATLFGSPNATKPSSVKINSQITPRAQTSGLISKILKINKSVESQITTTATFSDLKTADNTNILSAFKPRYYVRIVPMLKGEVAGRPSNDIMVEMVDPPGETKLYMPPKAYTVTIKDFQPLRGPDTNVCSHAMILDTDYVLNGTVIKKAGERICPESYKGIGEKAWYEQLWDGLKSGLSWVSEAYNKLKSSIVDVVGSAVCGGDSTCKMALSAGLDIGLTALGIPPTIPNFDQLMDGGFDYLAGEISAQAGCPDAICREKIKQELKKVLEQNENKNPGCDATMAHSMGIEPVCLPAGVTAHWDPVATYRDAQVILEIARNFVDVPGESMSTTSYKVIFTNWAINDKPVGSSIVNIEPYGKSMKIEKPLEGSPFGYKSIAIPYIAKGEKMEIPINLTATEYWVPGHKELMGGWTTVIYKDGWPQYQYDDWWKLYYGAQLTIQAQIDGCQFAGPSCIVSTDTKQINLPTNLNP